MYDNAVECATMNALNFNIQWHCRVFNNKDFIMSCNQQQTSFRLLTNLYDIYSTTTVTITRTLKKQTWKIKAIIAFQIITCIGPPNFKILSLL